MSDIIGQRIITNQSEPGRIHEALLTVPLIIAAGVGFVALEFYAHGVALIDRVTGQFPRS